MGKFRRHLFVCQNERPEGGKPSCGLRGGHELLRALETGLAEHPELWGEVAVTGSGCLGPCFDGPTMVVYPEGTWYGRVAETDAAELLREHLCGGRPVERLILHWEE